MNCSPRHTPLSLTGAARSDLGAPAAGDQLSGSPRGAARKSARPQACAKPPVSYFNEKHLIARVGGIKPPDRGEVSAPRREGPGWEPGEMDVLPRGREGGRGVEGGRATPQQTTAPALALCARLRALHPVPNPQQEPHQPGRPCPGRCRPGPWPARAWQAWESTDRPPDSGDVEPLLYAAGVHAGFVNSDTNTVNKT